MALKILPVVGTRPEAIKMAPVIKQLMNRKGRIVSKICATGQHREMLDQMLQLFGIKPDYDLEIMTENQSPVQVAIEIMRKLPHVIDEVKPDWVMVQGDTATTAAVSLVAYYSRIRLAHIEAGLRTFDKWHPFPEEINRKIAGIIADLHFAPTAKAKENLIKERIPEEQIFITGNTVIDALNWVSTMPLTIDAKTILRKTGFSLLPDGNSSNPLLIMVTAHRRENHGNPLENICAALLEIVNIYQSRVHIIYPVHHNPNIHRPVYRLLGGNPYISLIDPLDYQTFIHLLKRSHIVLTDSGGIQEEAPGLCKPVLVMREKTERPEGIESGAVKLVGTDKEKIITEIVRLIEDPDQYLAMSRIVNPYGDGHASERIVDILINKSSNYEYIPE